MTPAPVDDIEGRSPLRWGAGFDEALADLSRSLPPSIPALSARDRTELDAILRPKPTRWKAYRVPGDSTWRLCPTDCDRTDPNGPHRPDCEEHPSQAAAVTALWDRVDTPGGPR